MVVGILFSLAVAGIPNVSDATVCQLERSLDISEFAVLPRDIEVKDGLIYLLDAGECVVWALNQSGEIEAEYGGPGGGLGELADPYDMFWGRDGRLYVTDVGQRRLKALTPGTREWEVIDGGYSGFYGAASGSCLVYGADRARDRAPLRRRCGGSGSIDLVGRKITGPPGPDSLRNNLNYVRVAAGGGVIACAHVGLGYIQLLDAAGGGIAEILLDLPEAHAIRRWFWVDIRKQEEPDGPFILAELVADMARAARPGRFEIPVYVSDLAVRRGRIHVLCKNTILVYDSAGSLQRRLVMPRDRIFLHEFTLLPDGTVCGVDIRHYLKVHFLTAP